jgi:tetratricopeptide (TPR) repeat protein
LAAIYNQVGQYENALEAAGEAVRLDPTSPFGYGNLAGAYLGLNRFQEAKAVAEKQMAEQGGGKGKGAHFLLYCIAFIEGDTDLMQRHVDEVKGGLFEAAMLSFQAQAAAYGGQLRKAREFGRQSAQVAQRLNFNETAAIVEADEAVREAVFGHPRRAREKAAAALARSSSPKVVGPAAVAQALAGDADRAQALADELEQRMPTDTLLNAMGLPMTRAVIALERGDPTRAIELLEVAAPYELAGGLGLASIYVRGQAYLRAEAGTEAAAEFQKILDHRGVDPMSTVHSLAHLGLARAYALEGRAARSRQAYQDFLALWKDADPEVPLLQEAKAEYAQLNSQR